MTTRNAYILFTLLCATAFADSTVLDSVHVPINLLRETSGPGKSFSGKVTYFFTAGDNDSLAISLRIDPAQATPNAPRCTVTSVDGDVGALYPVNCMNGRREIFFVCSFATAPSSNDWYDAVVTMNARMSANETAARQVLAGIADNAAKSMILCGGSGTAPQHDAFCTSDITANGVIGLSFVDGPHGIVGWGAFSATMFPCNATSACAFDTSLMHEIGKAIAQEAKGLWQGRYVLLAPFVNLARDPRGGRDYEGFGEDPYLAGKLAAAYVRGVQDERVVAVPKGFVCNDEERDRTVADINVDTLTLRQTYAYPFEIVAREGRPWGMLAAYNKVNGAYCTESGFLVSSIIKKEWGLQGFVVSEWGTNMSCRGAESAGLDVEMYGNTQYSQLPQEVSAGRLSQASLDNMVLRVLRAKAWAGCMTSPPVTPNGYTIQQMHDGIGGINHQALADTAAHRAIVLLKNDTIASTGRPLLPIDAAKTVAVIGPYADILRVGGNGQYTSSKVTPFISQLTNTPLQAITRKLGSAHVTADRSAADYIVMVVGIASNEGTVSAAYEGHDRPDPTLSYSDSNSLNDQNVLIQGVLASYGNKTIVVLTGGNAIVDGAWRTAHSIVYAGFSGEKQGVALADVLTGDYCPAGRLTMTFPALQSDLPVFTNANMSFTYEIPGEGRGYPYYLHASKVPLFPFGFGLSYTTFAYSNLSVPQSAVTGDKVRVTVNVTNTGSAYGVEVPQLYISQKTPPAARPVRQLRGFARVGLAPGQNATVSFDLREWDFAHWTTAGGWTVDPNSTYDIIVGKNSMDPASLSSTIALLPAD